MNIKKITLYTLWTGVAMQLIAALVTIATKKDTKRGFLSLALGLTGAANALILTHLNQEHPEVTPEVTSAESSRNQDGLPQTQDGTPRTKE